MISVYNNAPSIYQDSRYDKCLIESTLYSPRTQTLLFMFSSANGLMVVSIVETCQECKKNKSYKK